METPEHDQGYRLAIELIQLGGPLAAARLRQVTVRLSRYQKSESIIEAAMFLGIAGCAAIFTNWRIQVPEDRFFIYGQTPIPADFTIWQQAFVANYHVDFLLTHSQRIIA